MIGISRRSTGDVSYDGSVTIKNILSYDIVSSPAFRKANFDFITDEEYEKMKIEEKNELRKKKLDSL